MMLGNVRTVAVICLITFFLLQGGAQISLADYDIQTPVRFRWYNLLSCAVSLHFNL